MTMEKAFKCLVGVSLAGCCYAAIQANWPGTAVVLGAMAVFIALDL